jgi:LacI family transcriptional regulator
MDELESPSTKVWYRIIQAMGKTRSMNGKAPPGLRDVAAAAGVSAMTASRALSGSGPVAPESRAAVEAAARRLGYRPNLVLRHLMSELRRGRTQSFRGVLAFLSNSMHEDDWRKLPYLQPCLEGARERARQSGFTLDEIWMRAPGWSPERTLNVLRARRARGLLIVPGCTPEQIAFPLDEFAVASFGGLAFPLQVNEVLPDHFHNHALCFRELHNLGYRRIGLYLPRYEAKITSDEAMGGFLAARERCEGANRIPVGLGAQDWQSAESDFKRWVRQTKPDAVIAKYNVARQWLEEIGLSVPRDIGLAHPGLAGDVPDWSGIDSNLKAQGSQAADTLTAQILRNERGLPSLPKRLTIRGVWVKGRTTRTQK